MKNIKCSCRILFISIAFISWFSQEASAQINFSKGYFITNNNDSVSCLIKDYGWDNNPRGIRYKLSNNDKVRYAPVDSIILFEIFNSSKYIKFRVAHKKDALARNAYDNFELDFPDEIFLKVLVEGKASLYSFKNKDYNDFYCKNEGKKIIKLAYELSNDLNNNTIENNTYRNQLISEFNCSELQIANINRMNFVTKDLVDFFISYNKCMGANYYDKTFESKRDKFNLTPRIGVNVSSLSIDFLSIYPVNYLAPSYEKNLRLGLEAELYLPFNKNKWAVLMEPVYSSFHPQLLSNYVEEINMDYIQLQLGLRHYFYITNNSSIFINVSGTYMKGINSFVQFKMRGKMDTNMALNSAFGIGVRHKKLLIEYRYVSGENILTNYMGWATSFKTNSLVLGYSFF